MVERDVAGLLADAQRHLEESTAYGIASRRESASEAMRERALLAHGEAIGAAKRCLTAALLLVQQRRAA